MKKTYNLPFIVITNILLVIITILTLTSCADNDYSVLNKGYDQLTLTSDQQATTLDEHTHANEAVLLSWTTGNNNGTGNRIYYQLELAPKGTNFQNSYVAVNNETPATGRISFLLVYGRSALGTLISNTIGHIQC